MPSLRERVLRLLPRDARYQLAHWRDRRAIAWRFHPDVAYTLAEVARLRAAFVHVPKAAGTSVCTALYGGTIGHVGVGEYKWLLGPWRYRRFFSFTVVRHPYTRLRSAFRFLRAGGVNARDRAWAEAHLAGIETFADFVAWLNPDRLRSEVHLRPQYSFLCDGGPEPQVDFVGRFERLDRDFDEICARIGIERRLPHRNPGPDGGPGRPRGEDELRARVAELYARDYALFGYDVDGP